MEWFENVNMDGKVIYFLCLVSLILEELFNSESYNIAKCAIQLSWQWVFHKNVTADDIYYYLENIEENDILSYLQMESNSEIEAVLVCMADALAYIVYEAYMHEKAEYLPETIEAVDDSTIEEFCDIYEKVCGSSKIMDEVKEFVINNFPQNESNVVRKEIIDNFITEKLNNYKD